MGGLGQDEQHITVFHCTTRECAENILREGFRFPSSEAAAERGLKLGAAVYFGGNWKYSEMEALNTLYEQAREQRGIQWMTRTERKELLDQLRPQIVTLEALICLRKRLSLGHYDSWVRATRKGGRGLKKRAFDLATECVTSDDLRALGEYEVITINEGTLAFEVAVFEPSAIVTGSLRLLALSNDTSGVDGGEGEPCCGSVSSSESSTGSSTASSRRSFAVPGAPESPV